MTSCVITTWNLLAWHRRCIVRARQEIPWDVGEIIVIDQHSNDGTEWYLRECLKEGLIDILQLLPENMGAAYSRNLGVKLATYDRVLLLDGDIVMPGNWVALANHYLDNHPKHVAISIHPAHCTMSEEVQTDYLERLNNVAESTTSCTNLGVYRKSYLEQVPFPETESFKGPGWGWEDTYQSMMGTNQGYRWVQVHDNKVAYLHYLNSGKKMVESQFGKKESDRITRDRQNAFNELSRLLVNGRKII